MLLPKTSRRTARAVASRARQTIASLELVNHASVPAPVTVGIGFALSTQMRSTDAHLLEAEIYRGISNSSERRMVAAGGRMRESRRAGLSGTA